MSSPNLRVGVRLTPDQDRLGEWLADASAFDAAGANALWVDLDEDAGLDPPALIAALAVVTSRARLVLPIDAGDVPAPRTLDTLRRLSHDRLTLLLPADRCDEVSPADVPVLTRHVESDDVEFGSVDGDSEAQRWWSVPAPRDRASWREICAAAAERGASGVVVDSAAVLLDILRNPHPTDDRRDLHIATG